MTYRRGGKVESTEVASELAVRARLLSSENLQDVEIGQGS